MKMKKILLLLFVLSVSILLVSCDTGETSSHEGTNDQEEVIELTSEEWMEIGEAKNYCNDLDSLGAFDTMDDWWQCVYGELSWNTENRYKKYTAQTGEK